MDPRTACECGHPLSEHQVRDDLKRGECMAYDADPKRTSPWCKCAIFRSTKKISTPYRPAKAKDPGGRSWITGLAPEPQNRPYRPGKPAPPNPTDYPVEKFAPRQWSRDPKPYVSFYEYGAQKYNEPSWPEAQKDKIIAEIREMEKLAQIDKALFSMDPIVIKADSEAFKKSMAQFGKIVPRKVENPSRPSKKTSKKAKASKLVDKLNLTRVPPVLDEEV